MGVGFADEFDREAKDCVECAENREVCSLFVRWKFASQDKHNCKEDQTFEDCFVELRWMPRHISREAAKEKTDRHTNKCKVQQSQVLNSHYLRAKKSANEAADKTSVEAHAAFVDRKNFQRVCSIISVAVEKHVAQPRPNYDASNSTQNARKDFVSLDMNFSAPGNEHQNNAGAGKTQDVGYAVSSNSEAPNLESNWIYTMKQFIHTYIIVFFMHVGFLILKIKN